MPRPSSKATVILTDGNLHFTQAGVYTIDYLPSGQVKIKLDGGKAHVMSGEEFAAIDSITFAPGASLGSPIRIDGISFTEAGPGGTFEISRNLDDILGPLITANGIEWAVDNIIVNGSAADTFKVLWDYLDDAYVAGNNYYDIALNETFVRLGVAYVDYLEAGGEPLTFVTAKYAADGPDADTIPQREQSMHDNLLGNLNESAVEGRFSGALRQELLDLIPDEYQDRPTYDGNQPRVGGAIHDAVRAFDYDHGWDRPDYIDRTYSGLIDPLARDGNQMYYGNGNTVDDWNIVRHEGAGVELGLKIKHRGGDEYPEASIDADGVAHYTVLAGSQIGQPGRAEWNFDFAATDFSADDDFTYTLELDFDPGEGTQWVTLYSSEAPLDSDLGTGATFQNSSNIAFYRNGIDADPATDGIQPYAFGEGTFNVRFSAFDADSGLLITQNEVIVHVESIGI